MTPHTKKNDPDARGRGDCGAFCATAAGNLRSPRCIMKIALRHNARRNLTSPALVMPPETSRSPDWLRNGVRPAHARTLFDEVKRAR